MAVAITDPSRSYIPLQSNWHASAPRRIAERYWRDDATIGWKLWQKHLARRRRPELPAFLTGRIPPLLWAWPTDWQAEDFRESLRPTFEGIDRLLAETRQQPPDLPRALQLVAAGYALPTLAQRAPAEWWWHTAQQLHDLAWEAPLQCVDWRADPHSVLRQHLLAGELPLALGYLFPENGALRGLKKSARAMFSETILELTDGQGMPHSGLWPIVGPLFACWTRARWLGERMPRNAWSRKVEYQYRWLVRHAVRLFDGDGRLALASDTQRQSAGHIGLLSAALDLVGGKRDRAAAQVATAGHVGRRRSQPRRQLPAPALDSEWSGINVLAEGWSPAAARLAVAYASHPMQIELRFDKQRLLGGAWAFTTVCDGKPLQIAGPWENVFWSSERDYDMLELSITLTNNMRLERQLLLARKDRVLYLADVVISHDGTSRRVQHTSHLPLGDCAQWQPEADTRDGLLVGKKRCAAVLPLALPEWRSDPRGGSLSVGNGQLTLQQESTGRALYCPLLIDLDPQRSKKERTWRQLTVAESMEVVPRDVAVGFRAQTGRHQWLFYRSLGPAGNRTVLGQNFAGEFCAGRFRANGKLDDWIEIEAI